MNGQAGGRYCDAAVVSPYVAVLQDRSTSLIERQYSNETVKIVSQL